MICLCSSSLILLSKKNFTDETEDEDVNREYIEETNRDALMIAAAQLAVSDKVSKVKIIVLIYEIVNFMVLNDHYV